MNSITEKLTGLALSAFCSLLTYEKNGEREMNKRTISGLAIGAITAVIARFSYIPPVMMAATAIVCWFCIYELASATGVKYNSWTFLLALASAGALCFFPVPDYFMPIFAGIALLVSIPYFLTLMKDSRRIYLQDSGSFIFLTLIITAQFSVFPRLRELSSGLHYVIIAVAECFVTDVAAYIVGSRWGKRKLLPSVSPNKTVLGSAAGLGAAITFCLLYGIGLHSFSAVQVSFGRLLCYAVVANMLAQFGDLSMSAVKRCVGIKDFSNLIPGHGGMLDRFDSHIFVLSFTYVFCCLSGGFIL